MAFSRLVKKLYVAEHAPSWAAEAWAAGFRVVSVRAFSEFRVFGL